MDSTPSAVLWDMDGTIVDTEPLWMTAQRELVAGVGVAWSEMMPIQRSARRCPSPHLMRAKGVELPADVIIDRLVESVAAAVNRHVPWLPGAYELLAPHSPESGDARGHTGNGSPSISRTISHVTGCAACCTSRRAEGPTFDAPLRQVD